MSLREELQQIYDRHRRLTPALIVAEATAEDHPLHSRFTWDDSVAGEKWRQAQARELIRSVRVVYREATEQHPSKSVRAFHAVHAAKGPSYEPAEAVAADPFTRKLVLADMEREWKALRRRYEDFAEFTDMVRRDLGEESEAA